MSSKISKACQLCGGPIRIHSKQTDVPRSGAGVHFNHKESEGGNLPPGHYHLGCLEFCDICGEVEARHYLHQWAGVCRTCHQEANQAVSRMREIARSV